MKCIVPGCNTGDSVLLEITCYRRIMGGSNQFIKTREKDILCTHHHLINTFAGILALKKYNPTMYEELKKETEEFLDSIPPEMRSKIITVHDRGNKDTAESKE